MKGKSEDQRRRGRQQRWLCWSLLAAAGLGLSLGAASCGGTAGSGAPLLQSNTNWLQRCGPDAPCSGALLCLCGMCTQPCAEAMECGRLEGATCGGSCDEAAPSGGGMCVLGCTTDDDCGAGFTCQATECRPQPATLAERALGDDQVGTTGACANAFVSLDNVFEHARLDLAQQDPEDRPYLRYLSLANRNDAGACEAELETERLALAKLLNSTSTNANVTLPVPVDADRLLYRINLLDYDWDIPRQRNGATYTDAWDMIVRNTPYGLAFQGPDASELSEQTRSPVPLIQADAFVHAAGRAEVYMALLGQPETIAELLLDLGVDAEANRADGAAWRAGTTQSNISRANRIIERHEIETRAGALWMTFDFVLESELDIEINPLATESDGGTVTYGLPNGLPAFAIYDDDGFLRADSDILLDTNQNNFRALTAVSCMRCHTDTIVPVSDEVRSYVAANPTEFSAEDRESVARLYPTPDALRDLMANDNARFRSALETVGAARGSADSVALVIYRFESDVTPSTMAGDLMLAPADIDEFQTAVGIGPIIDRDDFEQSLAQHLCTSLAGAKNRPVGCSSP